MNMVAVSIPTALRDYTNGQCEASIAAETVASALAGLAVRYPQLRRHLYTEQGELRSYVNIFLNQDDVRTLSGLSTPVQGGDTLMIVPSIAGG